MDYDIDNLYQHQASKPSDFSAPEQSLGLQSAVDTPIPSVEGSLKEEAEFSDDDAASDLSTMHEANGQDFSGKETFITAAKDFYRETRLQNRVVRKIEKDMAAIAVLLETVPLEIKNGISSLLVEERKQAKVEMAVELIDLYDRLQMSLDTTEQYLHRQKKRSFLKRLFVSDHSVVYQASIAGIRHILERVRDIMCRLEIAEAAIVGSQFDPYTMTAVQQRLSKDVPEGTVIEVLRAGFVYREKVLRLAEVVVSRRAILSQEDAV